MKSKFTEKLENPVITLANTAHPRKSKANIIFEKNHRLKGKQLFGHGNSNTALVILSLVIVISILLSGCKEKKTYQYSAITKMISINNTYNEFGFPKPDAGDGCTWSPMEFDNSKILINQSEDFVMIFDQNKIEEYKITETRSKKDVFQILTTNNKGKVCAIIVQDFYYTISITVKIPYEPARAYAVTIVDVEETPQELKATLDRIPR